MTREKAIVGHVAVADATGLSPEDVCRAARSLGRNGLVEYDNGYGGSLDFRDVTEEAYTLTGLHPWGEDERDALVELFNQAAQSEPDPGAIVSSRWYPVQWSLATTD